MIENANRFSRRQFLGAAGATIVGAGLAGPGARHGAAQQAQEHQREQQKQRVLRLGHLNDVHVQPERGATDGMVAALRHVQRSDEPPQLILTGGDAIMDSLAAGSERTNLQWRIWHQVIRDECSLPIEHCIGNHDVWGWDRERSKTSGKESQWGKERALDALGLDSRYRSFDRAGWHIVVLDSIFADPETVYQGRLDDEQFEWLAEDLNKVASETPILVVSHIPILTVATVEFEKQLRADPRRRRKLSHQDAGRIVKLFKAHTNVKLCLSGHLHLTERIEYAGVTYVCSGAVSGNWWKGKHHGTEEGYALVDLYDDGSFDWQYVDYGWQPPA